VAAAINRRTRAIRMEPGRRPSVGNGHRRGIAPESEALLSVLRPYCMSAVMAMEDLLGSGRNLASAAAAATNGPQHSSSAISSDAAAAHIAAGRRLEASLASLHSALAALMPPPSISLPSSSPFPSEAVRRAFP
ncbi:unnamed protein product, partial [Ectocarpus sp. 8 AP-2014]